MQKIKEDAEEHGLDRVVGHMERSVFKSSRKRSNFMHK